MKTLTKILAIAIILFAAACTKEEIKTNATLAGKWTSIGSYMSSGGPQYWVKATDDRSVTFDESGNLSGNFFTDYNKFANKDSVTIKLYSQADTTKYENYFYRIKHDTLTLSPREPYICIEGCSYLFVKGK